MGADGLESHLASIANNREHAAVVKVLVEWLMEDQSKEGHHFGQFGRHVDASEEAFFQPNKEEVLSLKPRLYLTGWPCVILARHGLAEQQVMLAAEGANRLLRHEVVHVSQSSAPDMPPDSTPVIVSFRHSIRAAQILLDVGKHLEKVRGILGRMFDPSLGWQNKDGGWGQSAQFRESDLWASVYAAALLQKLLVHATFFVRGETKNVEVILQRTVDYLEEKWTESKWAYGSVPPEQNASNVFIDVARVFEQRANPLYTAVLQWLSTAIEPTSGTIRESLFEKCPRFTRAQANTRFAYAFFLGGHLQERWKTLYDMALSHLDESVNSADVSFLLDMTIAIEKQQKSQACTEADVFICHASEDKESFVRSFAEALQPHVRVWYDEFSLTVGDSLRQKIDEGLKSSKFGVVVLSKAFFNKNWPQYELDGLAQKEMSDGVKVILPIWHGVSKEDVEKYSLSLAGRLAVTSEQSLDAIIGKILAVVRPNR
ncbi:MAG: toll/interleukin-1 receptor domain-containing protein [Phycisphaerales bacterium]|nr:toll/interleukin-1 receptor domain-containing protein [Phycisphaerales bacterium]